MAPAAANAPTAAAPRRKVRRGTACLCESSRSLIRAPRLGRDPALPAMPTRARPYPRPPCAGRRDHRLPGVGRLRRPERSQRGGRARHRQESGLFRGPPSLQDDLSAPAEGLVQTGGRQHGDRRRLHEGRLVHAEPLSRAVVPASTNALLIAEHRQSVSDTSGRLGRPARSANIPTRSARSIREHPASTANRREAHRDLPPRSRRRSAPDDRARAHAPSCGQSHTDDRGVVGQN